LFLIVIDVRPVALSESVLKECPVPAPEEDNCPVTLRLALTRPGDPLFNDPTSKIGIDLALFGPGDSVT
jgi:hypothetical protein